MTDVKPQLIDGFGRKVEYLRLSVTDRCDFRCVYCMAEEMTFLPRRQILSLEELLRIAAAFVRLGVSKIRLTGGEPLVRNGVLGLVQNLGQLDGLKQLVLTTNGSHLKQMAPALKEYGVRRINISLDSLNPEKFKQLTRTGNLAQVLEGIEAARAQGFEAIKLNTVLLKGRNDDEIISLVEFARDHNLDIVFIEEMPLGHITEHNLAESFISSDQVKALLAQHYALIAQPAAEVGGPAKYYGFTDSCSRVGFISPHSHNFCGDCNRVRLTVEGRLLLCLGNEHSVDLKAVVRATDNDDELDQAIIAAMQIKPERHYFDVTDEPQIVRFMNMTGG